MNYGRHALRRKMAPQGPVKLYRKIVSTILKVSLLILLAAIIAGGVYVLSLVSSVIAQAPDISGAVLTPSESATYIYNQAGERVQKLTLPEANRDIVLLESVPVDLQHAVVAIEDERFYEHKGIDPKGIVRAFIRGMSKGSFSEGASTITQQLLKNSVFPGWTQESSFKESLIRKIQEQYLALKLEKLMSKEQILENYLNMINLGAGCYGVQAASYRYFGKNVSDLTLSEATVIAGITQNPTAYNPIVYPENNARRRTMVLDAMLKQGYIDQAQYDNAMADDVYARIQNNQQVIDTSSSIYTYYQDALIDQVLTDLQNEKGYSWNQAYLAVYSGGLRIYSAQDDSIQAFCDEAFADPANFPAGTEVGIDYALSVQDENGIITDYGNDDLRAYVRSGYDPAFDLMYQTAEEARASARSFRDSVVKESDTVLGERVTVTPQPQASCVIIDQENGLVKALVGGRGSKDASLTLNRASYTTRQPGSTFKILSTYAPALNEGGKTLISTYVDEPYNYQGGIPVNNASNSYQGEVSIRDAIVQSINVVAVKCLTELSPRLGFEYAKRFGISTLVESYDNGSETLTDVTQTLALGGLTKGVTNLELTAAYACIANMGQYIEPKFYTEVLDQYGNVVLNNTEPKTRTVIRESTADLLTSAMKGVISDEAGTAYGLIDLGMMPVAGKSGTTSSYKDTWFVGYTPYYTCGIWGGYDNNKDLPDTDIYHSYCKILWNSIMNKIHAGLQITAFHSAPDTQTVNLCRASNMVASTGCPDTYSELFASGTQPLYYCSVHGNGGLVVDGSISSADDYNTSGSILITGAVDNTVIPEPEVLDYRVENGSVYDPFSTGSDESSDSQTGDGFYVSGDGTALGPDYDPFSIPAASSTAAGSQSYDSSTGNASGSSQEAGGQNYDPSSAASTDTAAAGGQAYDSGSGSDGASPIPIYTTDQTVLNTGSGSGQSTLPAGSGQGSSGQSSAGTDSYGNEDTLIANSQSTVDAILNAMPEATP